MTKKRVVAKWLNSTIWGSGSIYRHIFMLEDFTWLAVDPIDLQAGYATFSFTREHLTSSTINDSKNWLKIFEVIDDGAPPDWIADDFKCSCGAWATMGKRWVLHSSTCNFRVGPPAAIKNNDGRVNCYKCGQITKQVGGGAYNVCKNTECVWYDN